jgi:hypothetical protein
MGFLIFLIRNFTKVYRKNDCVAEAHQKAQLAGFWCVLAHDYLPQKPNSNLIFAGSVLL